MESIDLALWDINERRAVALKDRLDMFAGNTGATLIPAVPKTPIRAHDAVFLSFDECDEPVIRIARTVRRTGELTFILLVSDRKRDLSPLFRPKIRPGGVLYRPLDNAQIRDMLNEIITELDRLTSDGNDDIFVFKAEGATKRISLKDIMFFEASSKKVTIHTKGQMISYYDSIENLSSSLPSYFIRCHRSYIVNTREIKELRGTEMELWLKSGERVPYSRSCREVVKQAVNNVQSEEK